jgi:hypothetical protein
MTIPNYPCYEVMKFGTRVSEALFDANISSCMAGFGGCKEFQLADYEEDLHPYIQAYLADGTNSGAVIYAAMRTKEKELQ